MKWKGKRPTLPSVDLEATLESLTSRSSLTYHKQPSNLLLPDRFHPSFPSQPHLKGCFFLLTANFLPRIGGRVCVVGSRGRFCVPLTPLLLYVVCSGINTIQQPEPRGAMKPFDFIEEWELPLSGNFTVKPPLEDTSEFVLPPDLDLTNVV